MYSFHCRFLQCKKENKDKSSERSPSLKSYSNQQNSNEKQIKNILGEKRKSIITWFHPAVEAIAYNEHFNHVQDLTVKRC